MLARSIPLVFVALMMSANFAATTGSPGLVYYVLVKTDPEDPVKIDLGGTFSCQPGLCWLTWLYYSQRDPRGGFGYSYSDPGLRVSADLLDESVEWVLDHGPVPSPRVLDYHLTFTQSVHGSWAVGGVITNAAGALSIDVNRRSAVVSEELRTVEPEFLKASDFGPTMDATKHGAYGLGAGAAYGLDVQPERGLFGWYRPQEEGVVGPSQFTGPGTSGSCLQASVVGVDVLPELLGYDEAWPPHCARGWTLHGGSGPWHFETTLRASPVDRPWAMWADIEPPESHLLPVS